MPCDPVTAGTLLLSTAGSAYFQNKASQAVEKKRANVMAASDNDLKNYRDNAVQSFQSSLKRASPEDMAAGREEGRVKREEAYTKDIKQDELLPSSASGSEAAKRAIVTALGEAAETSKQRARNRAAVDAYGDTMFGRDVIMGRSSQNIGQQGNFAKGRSGVTAMELDAANSAGQKYANMAGIVKALGTLGSAAAGGGWFEAAAPKETIIWNSPLPGQYGPWQSSSWNAI